MELFFNYLNRETLSTLLWALFLALFCRTSEFYDAILIVSLIISVGYPNDPNILLIFSIYSFNLSLEQILYAQKNKHE